MNEVMERNQGRSTESVTIDGRGAESVNPYDLKTVPEACEILRISRAKLYEEIRDGRVNVRKFGSRIFLTMQDIRDYIDARSTKVAAAA